MINELLEWCKSNLEEKEETKSDFDIYNFRDEILLFTWTDYSRLTVDREVGRVGTSFRILEMAQE